MKDAYKELTSIRNFVVVDGRFGTAGQPTREQFPLIREAGYTAIINLAMPDHREAIRDEGTIVTGLGMTYTHLPVPFDTPCPEQARRFCDLLAALAGEKLFIHCIMNYRVSAFLYLYLRHRCGYAETQARSPMFERWQPDPIWQAVLTWNSDILSAGQN